VHVGEALRGDGHGLARADELTEDRLLARVLRVGLQQPLHVVEVVEVAAGRLAALEDLVADAEVGVGDLGHEVAAARRDAAADVVRGAPVPRRELARPARLRRVEQRVPVLLDADLIVEGVDERHLVVAVLEEGAREDGDGEVKVPEDGGDERVGALEEDAAGPLHLPVRLRPRQVLARALDQLGSHQRKGQDGQVQREQYALPAIPAARGGGGGGGGGGGDARGAAGGGELVRAGSEERPRG